MNKAITTLKKRFGGIDFESEAMRFDYTDYYDEELGTGLKRKFISFKKLVDPGDLAGIKRCTNRIETSISAAGKRSVNIDPGYLDMAKLVLATAKDFNHRVYLSSGIFAEVTLYYAKGSFRHWDWTYPDYRSAEYIAVFNQIRKIYSSQIGDVPQSATP